MNRSGKFLIIIFSLTFILVISSCSKTTNSLDMKKEELAKLKTQQNDLLIKITALEKEIKESGGIGNNNNLVLVNYQEIKPEIFKRVLDIQGTVESMKASIISCKIPGQVVKILVSEGQAVSAGQLLMQIDDETMQKGMTEAKTGLEFATTLYEKQKRLWEQKAGSEIQFLQAKNTKESIEQRIATLESQIANAKIYAPFAGIVDQIIPKLGETVSPGFGVFRLTSMADVKVTAEISETYISSVHPGDPVDIYFPDLKEHIAAKISVITKMINPVNRTFKIDIALPRLISTLRPNQVCQIGVNDITIQNAITAPLKVIQKSGEQSYLFVVKNDNGINKALKVNIKTGLSYKDKVQVLEGLSVNDKIITDGSFDVSDGQLIRFN